MTERDAPPTTTSEIGGIRAHSNFQAIDATFYNLTDTDGRAVAGLLVLLDRLHRPVRAELHFYEEVDGFARDNTVRQAQLLLQQRYYSREPVKLRIMYAVQDRNAYDVPLPSPETSHHQAKSGNTTWRRIAAIVAAVVLVAVLVWLAMRLFGPTSTQETADSEAPVAAADAVGEADAVSDNDAAETQSTEIQAQELPPSINARDDLAVGMRVIIQPGLQSYILTEPNLSTGESIGAIQDGEGALLLDGPILRQGESDTIVWWYATTDSGLEGWIPANTSQLTLLVPEE